MPERTMTGLTMTEWTMTEWTMTRGAGLTPAGSTMAGLTMAGFTLVEMLAVLLLLAELATSGVPAFTDLLLKARMTAQVNRFVHGVHLANQTAHQALAQVALCKSADGLQCGHSMDWHDGWIVFVNHDGDNPPRVDPGERILNVGAAFQSGLIDANRAHFVFRPFETRSTNGTLTFCDRRGPAESRRVIVSYTGRPRVASAGKGDPPGNASGTCPA